ncbi:MAG: porin family protein [Burkholderiales bacterium]|nr:porin family protein [Burkholderiales bacterium]
MLKKILIASLGLISINAYATANNGAYVGVSAGLSNQSMNFANAPFNLNTNGSNLDNNQWGGLVRLFGGYNFSSYTGVEMGASINTGTTYTYPNNAGTMNMNTTTWDLSYIPMLPIKNSDFTVFGRVGVAYDWISNSGYSGGSQSGLEPSGSNLVDMLGAGVRYKFNNHFTMKVEWIAEGLLFPVPINSGGTNVASWDQQTFQTGVSYHF